MGVKIYKDGHEIGQVSKRLSHRSVEVHCINHRQSFVHNAN